MGDWDALRVVRVDRGRRERGWIGGTMWLRGMRGVERWRKQHVVCRSNLLRSISRHAGARVCIAGRTRCFRNF